MKLPPVATTVALPALESLVIFASQNAVATWESSTSTSFAGWNAPVPTSDELITSPYFEGTITSTVALTLVWLIVGWQYKGLYDSTFVNTKWSLQTTIDLTNQQFINMANIVLLSSFLLLASLHKIYPIEEVTLHFLAMYAFIVGFRLVYFVSR